MLRELETRIRDGLALDPALKRVALNGRVLAAVRKAIRGKAFVEDPRLSDQESLGNLTEGAMRQAAEACVLLRSLAIPRKARTAKAGIAFGKPLRRGGDLVDRTRLIRLEPALHPAGAGKRPRAEGGLGCWTPAKRRKLTEGADTPKKATMQATFAAILEMRE